MSTGHETYVIKSGGRPTGDPSKYDFSTIQSLLEATNPDKVSAAGAAYNSAARIVAELAHQLYRVGTDLGTKWDGADAEAAQKALGQLYATANELYWRSQQAGTALQTYGAALPQYKGLQWPSGGASPVEDPDRQKAAETVMRAVNQHIGNAWDTMPDKVQADFPNVGGRDETPYKPGTGAGGVPSGSTGAGGSGGGGGGGSDRVALPHLPRGGDPGGGHGTELAGLSPVTSGPAAGPPPGGSPFPSGAPGGIPSLPGGGPVPGGMPSYPGGGFVPGSLRSGAVGGVPAEEPMPSGRLPGSAAAANAAATEEAEAAQAARAGMTGPTSGPVGGGNNSMERRREVWRAEERRTWTSGDKSVPEVLGGSQPNRRAGDDDAEREHTTWLSEEHEVWAGDGTAVPGTIGDAPSSFDEADDIGLEDLDEEEPDILDPGRLQELLDALVPDEETDGGRSETSDTPDGLLSDVQVEETNTIARLLNG